jgi:4-hydroxy-tetrahydrodipicolinate synthase
MVGLKDSSGEHSNLASYRSAVTREEQVLFVGDENLLIDALRAGWSGTISGAANVIAHWICPIVRHWFDGEIEAAETKFEIVKPIIERIRQLPQPSTHKAILVRNGLLDRPTVRLPLTVADETSVTELEQLIEARIGALV